MYEVLKKGRKHNLSISCQLDLFDKLVKSIFLYGCEVWGFGNNEILERVQFFQSWPFLRDHTCLQEPSSCKEGHKRPTNIYRTSSSTKGCLLLHILFVDASYRTYYSFFTYIATEIKLRQPGTYVLWL